MSEDSGVGFSGISRTTQTFESKRETASLMSVLARNSLSVTMETNLSAFSASMIFADLWCSPPKAPFCLPHTNKIGLLSRLCFCRALRIVSWNCPPQSLAIWIMSERAYRASPVSTKWKLMTCPILIRTQKPGQVLAGTGVSRSPGCLCSFDEPQFYVSTYMFRPIIHSRSSRPPVNLQT